MELCETESGKSFTDHLLQAGESIVIDILSHPLILSLADVNQFPKETRRLSRNELIQARNNFYVQDYFFLIYGYRVPKAIVMDTTPTQWLRDDLNKDGISILAADVNPLLASSIKRINDELERIGLSIKGKSPNKATEEYIIFKIKSAFRGDAEGLTTALACVWVYYSIGAFILQSISNNKYFNDSEFQVWVKILTDEDNEDYFKKASANLNRIVTSFSHISIEQLENIFLEACRFEFRFIEALLS